MQSAVANLFGETTPFSEPSWYHGFKSPYYGDSHKKLRAYIRPIFEKHIFPFVNDWDEAYEIPRSVYKIMGEHKLNVLCVGHPFAKEYSDPPEPLIGEKIDGFHELILNDELSRCGSGGVLWGLAGGLTIGLPPVLNFGSQYLKDKVVPGVLSGDKVICLAITEPTAGSDVSAIRTFGEDRGDHYLVNGEKKWITNGIFADFFTVAVRTGGPGMGGISLMLLEKNMPGLKTKRIKCTGVWCSGTTFVEMENVKVPKENVIGRINEGFKYIMHNFNHERLALCVQTVRFSRVCLADSIRFAQKRKAFGKTLIEQPVIRWKIGEMARQIEANFSLLENMVYNFENMSPQEANLTLGGATALLKVQSTKTMEYCSRESIQIFGGLGYSRGGQGAKVERLGREVRAMAIPGGSEEIMIDLGVRQSLKLQQAAEKMKLALKEGKKKTKVNESKKTEL